LSFAIVTQESFERIPGSPLAYWVSEEHIAPYERGANLGKLMKAAVGLNTGDNNRFLRYWQEVDLNKIGFNFKSLEDAVASGKKWFPYNKGGKFRRWYGNQELVLNWENDGQELKDFAVKRNGGRHWSRYIQNLPYMLQHGITWSDITTNAFAARSTPQGFFFDVKGSSGFVAPEKISYVLGLLCSKITTCYMKILNPSTTFQVGDISRIPFIESECDDDIANTADELVLLAKGDWDIYETSWEFLGHPTALADYRTISNIEDVWSRFSRMKDDEANKVVELETRLNKLLIEVYGLQNHIIPKVEKCDLTLSQINQESFSTSLISYAIGCMMGRYSLDEPGLIYAHAGNIGFDSMRYKSFPADADGIVPINDQLWFEDDAANRIREFLLAVWGADTLDENMAWLAESLGQKGTETSEKTIRRCLSASFFKDHLQTYKKRPIYWLFSSGKQKAFECLVYLHRYNDATLSRMRSSYVIPLQGKIAARIDFLKHEIDAADSTATKRRLSKEMDVLMKKQAELKAFDEELRHYADQKINLDLDDGVKVNYSKFGSLLAEVKAVTGKEWPNLHRD
jgi:hypothetical protein